MRQELKDGLGLLGAALAAAAALLLVLVRPIASGSIEGGAPDADVTSERAKVARRNALHAMALWLAAISAACQFVSFML